MSRRSDDDARRLLALGFIAECAEEVQVYAGHVADHARIGSGGPALEAALRTMVSTINVALQTYRGMPPKPSGSAEGEAS